MIAAITATEQVTMRENANRDSEVGEEIQGRGRPELIIVPTAVVQDLVVMIGTKSHEEVEDTVRALEAETATAEADHHTIEERTA